MSITGRIRIDLVDVKRERQRHRLAALTEAPANAEVVIEVGALAVEPSVVPLLLAHSDRLRITVVGTPRAVRLWLAAVREGLVA